MPIFPCREKTPRQNVRQGKLSTLSKSFIKFLVRRFYPEFHVPYWKIHTSQSSWFKSEILIFWSNLPISWFTVGFGLCHLLRGFLSSITLIKSCTKFVTWYSSLNPSLIFKDQNLFFNIFTNLYKLEMNNQAFPFFLPFLPFLGTTLPFYCAL